MHETICEPIIYQMRKLLVSLKRYKWIVPILTLVVLIVWLLETPAGLLGKADAIGYAVCHQIPARMYHLDDRPLPLCVRCSGMYLGAMAGLIYQFLRKPRHGGMLTWKSGIPFLILAAAWALDGFNSFIHLIPGVTGIYEPSNNLRLITGLGMGTAMAAIVAPIFHQTIWSQYSPQEAFTNLRAYLELLAVIILTGLLAWTENPLILYPFALISAAGVMVVLTMVYTMVWVMVFRQENSFHTLQNLVVPLSAGFLTALLQIALIDYLRYQLTGTWGGFTF